MNNVQIKEIAIPIEELVKMTIGQIKEHEEMDLIDRKKENAAAVIEQAKIDKKWATDFLKEMEIEE